MYPVEPPVRHHQYYIAFLEPWRQVADDRIRVLELLRAFSSRSEITYQLVEVECGFLRVPIRAEERGKDNLVRTPKSLDVVVLEFPPLRGVAARLEHRNDAPAFVLLPDRVYRLTDRGRMVREIVDHGDTANLTANLHSALHAGERLEPGAHPLAVRLDRFSRGDDSEHVSHVESAGEWR